MKMDTLKVAHAEVADRLANHDLSTEQRKIARLLAGKLLSALQIELPFVYAENNDARCYTLSAKRGVVHVAIVVTTPIPK